MNSPIYLDYHATTPVDERVLEAMLPYFTKFYANPSGSHIAAWQAKEACEKARETHAQILTCDAEDIYFTASATEANNWVFYTVAENYADKERFRIITTAIEHKSVLKACEKFGANMQVDFVKVDKNGIVDLNHLEELLKQPGALLVSIMHGNNEIGSVQGLAAIAGLCKQYDAFFHTDAVQTFSKYEIDLSKIPVDFLSWSAHKFYGPKGIGGLFARKNILMKPMLVGGAHEKGLRASTLNVPSIVGMAEAAKLTYNLRIEEGARLKKLRDDFQEAVCFLLSKESIQYKVNNNSEKRLVNNLSISLGNRSLGDMQADLRLLCYSTGSACSSGTGEVSHVLKAIGLEDNYARNTFRLSLGRMTTTAEVEQALDILAKAFS